MTDKQAKMFMEVCRQFGITVADLADKKKSKQNFIELDGKLMTIGESITLVQQKILEEQKQQPDE